MAAAAKPKSKKTAEPEVLAPSEVPEKEIDRLESSLTVISDRADALTIRSQSDYDIAAEMLTTEVNPFIDLIGELFDENVRLWYDGHKKAVAKRKKYLDPAMAVKRTINAAMERFTLAERRRVEEERRRLERSQQEAAEEEALRRAQEAKAEGDDEEAARILAELDDDSDAIQPIAAPPPPVFRGPKADGVSARTTYDFEIIDESKIDRRFMMPDERAIKAMVKSKGPKAVEMVGAGSIRVFEKVTIASGRR